jgi:small Trp-rich protein
MFHDFLQLNDKNILLVLVRWQRSFVVCMHSKFSRLSARIDHQRLSPYACPKRRSTMPIIVIIVLLSILKYLEVDIVANLSWWWIAGLLFVAFIWFEFVERIFGLDKRAAHEQLEKNRQERVKKAFENNRRR